jgi:hypothetical protein
MSLCQSPATTVRRVNLHLLLRAMGSHSFSQLPPRLLEEGTLPLALVLPLVLLASDGAALVRRIT